MRGFVNERIKRDELESGEKGILKKCKKFHVPFFNHTPKIKSLYGQLKKLLKRSKNRLNH